MDKLNSRTNKFTIVLNDSGADLFHDSQTIVRKLRCCDDIGIIFIGCIKHDKDYDEQAQHVKTVHYHLVLVIDRICRIGTMINLLVKLFKCNENQISIDKCTSVEMQTRYLIHFDDLDKFQYQSSDISTNDSSFVEKCLKYIKTITSINDLIAICREYPKLTDLMCVLGFENYRKYRVVIADIRKEISTIY